MALALVRGKVLTILKEREIMKKTMIFLFAGLLVNVSAFAVGPDKTVDCKEIADKVKQAKAAAASANSNPQPGSTDTNSTSAQ
jgi:hypothetical protein